MEGQIQQFTSSALEEGGWSAPHLGHFTSIKDQHSLYSKVRHTIEYGNKKLSLNPVTLTTRAVLLDFNVCKYFIKT